MWISRTALNEALHELRRPLQALALAGSAESAGGSPRLEDSVQLAASALERLDREINGDPVVVVRTLVAARPLLEASLTRWRPRAALAGAKLELRWRAGEVVLEGDRCGLSQALDNLVVNAIEHGGPRVVVAATRAGAVLRIAVSDSGGKRRGRPARRRGIAPARRLAERRRHGHGLRVVRRIVALHGGRFELRRSANGTAAVLELPLLGPWEQR
jgi:signal transduction histidine kinase